VIRRYRLCAGLVLALMACNVFIGLGSVSINDSDEARYGVSAYEMLQNRSFLVTTYAGEREYWNLKPPLGYWLMALSFWIFGPTPFAMRLPAALCGLGAVALSMALGRRWLGRRAGILTGLIMATAFGFLSNHGARSGDLDAALTFLLLLALSVVSRLGESPWRVVSLGALLAVGFLLKSFAILPLIVVAALSMAWSGAWRRQRVLPCLVALLVFAVPVAGWAVARCQADGSTYFLARMVREDLLARSTSVIDKVTYSPLGYVGTLFDRFAPWPVLILTAALLAGWDQRTRARALARRLRGMRPLVLLWAVVPFVLFSLSQTQHHWYLDPSYPAWAMLAALAVLGLVRRAAPGRRPAVLAACVLLPLALCEVRVLYRVLIAERMPESQRILASLADHRLELGPTLRTGPLRHSERFILQAMDGFQIEETGADGTRAARFEERSVLIAKAANGPRPQPSLGSGIFIDTRDYLLYQSSSQIAGRSAPRQKRHTGHRLRRSLGHHLRTSRPRSRVIPT
jgi:4-amino-4-deoxy-L-arabinose transferase-like glycosyltransferase